MKGVGQPTAELLLSVAQDITDLGKISRDLSSPASIGVVTPSQSPILKETKHSSDRGGGEWGRVRSGKARPSFREI